ncbi:hypothetical protein BN7_1428 [Wickerhamomyces ciferrii]|uniref:NAD-dependent epimerase/dehydratase domain-containing protein n=1 Tax=Wickerhamomyces ciferrii (strain ATCC 14091 / BCRC 22168 / CBS 111 / JCM 3599 / NBRC 0793 / NRRL Y-1031 F-60-10) TaxID=1206466 RepID=K0KKA0_WICCF|nr:uncharacterized protein BN7_1428 [Wickerhamomyces ciferrii]CCH41889.1 hypothetical protein BN7_1428 [Wickerhamomyces ciferrii]
MTILITGATGFIALHIIQQLLEQNYKVIGTVRSSTKGDDLITKFNNSNFQYEIVSDLTNSQEFNEIFSKNKGIKTVIHTASGVTVTNEVEKYLLEPAVKGTTTILNSIKNHASGLENFVFTSSVGALNTPGQDGKGIYRDESTWNTTTWEQSKIHPLLAYCFAKAEAERLVWKFSKENENINVTVINPSFVFGPQVFQSSVSKTLNSSNELITTILKDGESYNKVQGHFIDVRDVAKAHLYAFTKPEVFGKRLVLIDDHFTEQSIIDSLNKQFPVLQGKISKGDESRKRDVVYQDKNVINTEKTKKLLGFKYISLDESLKDTIQQILDAKVFNEFE